jgi:hypothetical protein
MQDFSSSNTFSVAHIHHTPRIPAVTRKVLETLDERKTRPSPEEIEKVLIQIEPHVNA